MTDEAAESRGPATPQDGEPPRPPLSGPSAPAAGTRPEGRAQLDPDEEPTASIPVSDGPFDGASDLPPDPASGAGAPPPGTGTPPPHAGYAGAAGPQPGNPGGYPGTPGPPPGYGPQPGAAFASRYGLVRPRQGRYLAGVCAAIGRATNTDPILWRVLLAVLGFFGGIGILIYVAAWLIIPAEGDTASPVESMLGRGRSSMSPVTVIVLSVLVAVMFGLVVTNGFRAVLLGAAVLIGGALLLNRNTAGGRIPRAAAAPGGQPGVPPPPAYQSPAYQPPAYQPPAGVPPTDPSTGSGYPPAASPAYSGGYPPATSTGGPTSGGPTSGGPSEQPPVWPPTPASTGGPSSYPAQAPYPGSAPATTPLPAWPGAATAAAPPPVDRGYRPAFAPRGPYASGGHPSGGYPPPPPPPTKPPKPPKPPRERSPLGAATFSMIFVAIGLVTILDLTNTVPITVSAYFAAALVTIALGLLVGTWFGRARWLIALGLAAAAALGISTLAEPYAARGDDQVVWAPSTYDELANRYETSFGDATLDLSRVDFTGRDANLTVRLNFGTLRVVVPPTVDVTSSVDLKAGDARIFDSRWSGVDNANREVTDLGPDGAGGGKLRLDLHVNAGDVEVSR